MLYVLSSFITCIISIILVIPLIPRKDKTSAKASSLNDKSYSELHKKYGLYLVLSGIIPQIIGGLIITFLYVIFGVVVYLTYLMICNSVINLGEDFSGSSKSSYTSIFSRINREENLEDYKRLFYQLNKYIVLYLSIIVALLFFFIEIFIIIIYSEIYLIIIIGIQFYLISVFAQVIKKNLNIITMSTNRTKINFYTTLIQSLLSLLIVIIVLLFFGFYTLLLLFFLIQFIMVFLVIFLINRKSNINLSYYKIFKPFLLFLISFLITLPFFLLIKFNLFPKMILLNSFFNGLFGFLIFFLIFYLIIFFSKSFTKEEFNQMLSMVPFLRSDIRLMRKTAKIIEKFLPSKRG